jgi:hypothetical protein
MSNLLSTTSRRNYRSKALLIGIGFCGIYYGVTVGENNEKLRPFGITESKSDDEELNIDHEKMRGSLLFSRDRLGTPDDEVELSELISSSLVKYGNVREWPASKAIEVNILVRDYLSKNSSVAEVADLLEKSELVFNKNAGAQHLLVIASIDCFGKSATEIIGKVAQNSAFLGEWCARLLKKEGVIVFPDIVPFLEAVPRLSTRRRIVRDLLSTVVAAPDYDPSQLADLEGFWTKNFGDGFEKEMVSVYASEMGGEEVDLLVRDFVDGGAKGFTPEQLTQLKTLLVMNPKLLSKTGPNFSEEGFPADDRLVAKALAGWISTDAQGSVKWFNQRSIQWRLKFLTNEVGQFPARFAQSALASFADAKADRAPIHLLEKLAIDAIQGDPLETINTVKILGESGHIFSWENILESLPDLSGIAKKEEIVDSLLSSVVDNAEAVGSLSKWLAKDSPEFAIDWITKNIDSREVSKEARNQVITYWAQNDPPSVLRWMEETSSLLDNKLVKDLGNQLAQWNWKDALEWARGLPEEDASSGIFAVLSTGVVPPNEAVVIINSQLEAANHGGSGLVAAARIVGSQLGITDPKLAVNWAGTLKSEEVRDAVIEEIMGEWTKWDPHSVAFWINEGNTVSDDAIRMLAMEIPGDPATAIVWAMTMKEGNTARDTALKILQREGDLNASSVESILNEAQLPLEQREAILRQIKE